MRASGRGGGRAGGAAAAGPGAGDSARLRLGFRPSRRGSWKTSGEDASPPLCSLPPLAGGRRLAGEGAGRTPAIGRGRTWGALRRRPPAVGNSCFSPRAARRWAAGLGHWSRRWGRAGEGWRRLGSRRRLP